MFEFKNKPRTQEKQQSQIFSAIIGQIGLDQSERNNKQRNKILAFELAHFSTSFDRNSKLKPQTKWTEHEPHCPDRRVIVDR